MSKSQRQDKKAGKRKRIVAERLKRRRVLIQENAALEKELAKMKDDASPRVDPIRNEDA